jgi:hypothetical protein
VATLHKIASYGSPKVDKGYSSFLRDSKVRIAVIMSFATSISLTVVLWKQRPVLAQKEALRKLGAAATI